MTIPSERTRAVQYAMEFLESLLYRDITPGVPKEIRERARNVLRHYPWCTDLMVSHRKLPDTWGKPEKLEDFPARLAKYKLKKK